MYRGESFIDLCGCFVGREDTSKRDMLHLGGKGAAVYADELLRRVDISTGNIHDLN